MPHAPIEPHLWTADLPRLIAFWRDVFGFDVAQSFPDAASPTWCQLALGGATVMIGRELDPEAAPNEGAQPLWRELASRFGTPGAVVHYVEVPDVDAVHRRTTAAGLEPLEALWDAWWGCREFTVADPDGNLICFFTPLE